MTEIILLGMVAVFLLLDANLLIYVMGKEVSNEHKRVAGTNGTVRR